MKRYASTVAAAPLVGSEAKGSVRLQGNGERITLPLGGYELKRLRTGLALLARAFLKGGAERILLGAGVGREIASEADVTRFEAEVNEITLLRLGTGHPQGGNAMSTDPKIGVVDPDFRVRGIANVRVCDGSIFPASAGVNPQWTIMALAHCCAKQLGA
jgi:choline dehydrogenase-like flavoprotein